MRDRSRARQYLSPAAVMGRALTCTTCGELVDLIEIPRLDPRIDATNYVCGECLQPVAEPAYKRSGEAPTIRLPLAEPPAPPRPLATQIRDYVDTAFGNPA